MADDRPIPRASRRMTGKLDNGSALESVRLTGRDGFAVTILTYGARVHAIDAPDRHGVVDDVVLGPADLAAYPTRRNFFGATIGRYANRIAGAAFTLDGQCYAVDANEHGNSLHGGRTGFDTQAWTIASIDADRPSVTLERTSPDGEGGYPGQLHVKVTYTIDDGTALCFDVQAATDQTTVMSVTNHSFFNLAGQRRDSDIKDHILSVTADRYLPVDDATIPLRSSRSVDRTPFDFRIPTRLGARIADSDTQIARANGIDHHFCFADGVTDQTRTVALVSEPVSGRTLIVETNQPGMQIYTGNKLDGTDAGKRGQLYRRWTGLCLEPQIGPNGPNRSDMPMARLEPGQVHHHRTIYRFATDAGITRSAR